MTDKKQEQLTEQLTEQELDKVTGGWYGIHIPNPKPKHRKGAIMWASEQEPEDNK